MKPTLAIVIPYFKAVFFRETLASLKAQSNKDFTLYIADDASPEPAKELVAEQLGDTINYNYHRFDTNLGGRSLTKHWKRSLELLDSETWVCILGDDDVLSPNFVSEFYASLPKLEQEPSNLLRFTHSLINAQGETIGTPCQPVDSELAVDAFANKYYGDSTSSLSEYIFRRATFKTYGFRDYPLAWCSDDMAWLEFSEGRPILGNKNATLYFRLSNQSISGSLNNNKTLAKRAFFEDLVREKAKEFPRAIRLKNLDKLEQYYALTKNYNMKAMFFFMKEYLVLGSFLEAVMTKWRWIINSFRK